MTGNNSTRISKRAFMEMHEGDVRQVSDRLRGDWAEHLQHTEVVARIEGFMVEHRRYFELRDQSLRRLAEQWEGGVRGVHDDCSIVSEGELLRWQYSDKLLSKHGTWHIEREDEMADEELAERMLVGLFGTKRVRRYKLPFGKVMGRYISDRFRCGSITCRPGDPFGCALGKRRMHMDRISMMLQDWRAHGTTEVGRFEIMGQTNEPLADVLKAEQKGFNRMLTGGAWISIKQRGGLRGHVCTLSISRDPEERRWVVRRWLIVARAGEREADTSWEHRMFDRWTRTVTEQGAYPHRAASFIDVKSGELAGLAQLVASAVSELDPPSPGYERIEAEFAVSAAEQSIGDLWQIHGNEWEELVRALDGDKMLTVSRSGTDHPAWAAASKRAREAFRHPDWRRPARPQLSFDGLPPAPTPYEVLSPGAARRRKIKPGDRVYVLKAGRSWDRDVANEWKARRAERLERYLRATGVLKGGKA